MPVTVSFSRSDKIRDRFQIWGGKGNWRHLVKTGRGAATGEAENVDHLLRKAVRLGAVNVSVLFRGEPAEEFFGELIRACDRVQGAQALCVRVRVRKKPGGDIPDLKPIEAASVRGQWTWKPDTGRGFDASKAAEKRWRESFRGQLFHLVDERGLKDSQVYKKANVDRRLYSKIRCGQDYHPRKRTILALAMALELNLEETEDLLARAGASLSETDLTDQIFVSFVSRKRYSVPEINELLFACNLPVLGGEFQAGEIKKRL